MVGILPGQRPICQECLAISSNTIRPSWTNGTKSDKAVRPSAPPIQQKNDYDSDRKNSPSTTSSSSDSLADISENYPASHQTMDAMPKGRFARSISTPSSRRPAPGQFSQRRRHTVSASMTTKKLDDLERDINEIQQNRKRASSLMDGKDDNPLAALSNERRGDNLTINIFRFMLPRSNFHTFRSVYM